jgi:hypothetical protein
MDDALLTEKLMVPTVERAHLEDVRDEKRAPHAPVEGTTVLKQKLSKNSEAKITDTGTYFQKKKNEKKV